MSKEYTVEEMREAASSCETVEVADQFYSVEMDRAAAMLRQAADSEEKNAELKARLETVVKMLEEKERATSCFDCGRYNGYPCADHDECVLFKHHEEFTAILRAARGEGGAE